jgi:hypothetical protein
VRDAVSHGKTECQLRASKWHQINGPDLAIRVQY